VERARRRVKDLLADVKSARPRVEGGAAEEAVAEPVVPRGVLRRLLWARILRRRR